MRNKTFVIGCGRLGSRLAVHAYQNKERVTVIDTDERAFERLSDGFAGFTQVGDATDVKTLEKLDFANAKTVIIVTGDDNANLFLAHLAYKHFQIPHIYVRFDDPSRAPLIKGMPIKAIYPTQLSFETVKELRGEN